MSEMATVLAKLEAIEAKLSSFSGLVIRLEEREAAARDARGELAKRSAEFEARLKAVELQVARFALIATLLGGVGGGIIAWAVRHFS